MSSSSAPAPPPPATHSPDGQKICYEETTTPPEGWIFPPPPASPPPPPIGTVPPPPWNAPSPPPPLPPDPTLNLTGSGSGGAVTTWTIVVPCPAEEEVAAGKALIFGFVDGENPYQLAAFVLFWIVGFALLVRRYYVKWAKRRADRIVTFEIACGRFVNRGLWSAKKNFDNYLRERDDAVAEAKLAKEMAKMKGKKNKKKRQRRKKKAPPPREPIPVPMQTFFDSYRLVEDPARWRSRLRVVLDPEDTDAVTFRSFVVGLGALGTGVFERVGSDYVHPKFIFTFGLLDPTRAGHVSRDDLLKLAWRFVKAKEKKWKLDVDESDDEDDDGGAAADEKDKKPKFRKLADVEDIEEVGERAALERRRRDHVKIYVSDQNAMKLKGFTTDGSKPDEELEDLDAWTRVNPLKTEKQKRRSARDRAKIEKRMETRKRLRKAVTTLRDEYRERVDLSDFARLATALPQPFKPAFRLYDALKKYVKPATRVVAEVPGLALDERRVADEVDQWVRDQKPAWFFDDPRTIKRRRREDRDPKLLEELAHMTRKPSRDKETVRDMFDKYDEDRSGGLDVEEVAYALGDLGALDHVLASWGSVEEIFEEFDDDQNGTMDFTEFTTMIKKIKQLKRKAEGEDVQEEAAVEIGDESKLYVVDLNGKRRPPRPPLGPKIGGRSQAVRINARYRVDSLLTMPPREAVETLSKVSERARVLALNMLKIKNAAEIVYVMPPRQRAELYPSLHPDVELEVLSMLKHPERVRKHPTELRTFVDRQAVELPGSVGGASGVPAFLTAPPVRFPDEDELDSARETTTRSNSSSNDGRGRARGDAYAVVDVGEGGSESESEDDDGLDEDGRFRYHIV